MRRYILGIVVLLAACGGSEKQAEAPGAPQEQQAGMGESTAGPVDPKTKIDPVCGMDWDTTWTEWSVYKTDTIRFCSEGCKMAFEARPGKYVKG